MALKPDAEAHMRAFEQWAAKLRLEAPVFKYEVWESEDKKTHKKIHPLIFPADPKDRQRLTPDAKLLCIFEATCWMEAREWLRCFLRDKYPPTAEELEEEARGAEHLAEILSACGLHYP